MTVHLILACAYDEKCPVVVNVNGDFYSGLWAVSLPNGWTVRLEPFGDGQVRWYCPKHTPGVHVRPSRRTMVYGTEDMRVPLRPRNRRTKGGRS